MKKTLALTFLLSLASNAWPYDSQYLIQEVERLRDSLALEDPARIDLTLKLADLYFDVSIQEGKSEDVDLLKKSRLKAFELYQRSLKNLEGGKDSKAPLITGQKNKIQFQMARLLSRLDENKTALKYYLGLLEETSVNKTIKEQSALALAEWYEEETQLSKAKTYYDQAISLCETLNSCNYANYRKAWLLYKDSHLDEAIATMEKTLWNDNGSVRENSLADLLLFMSNKETDGLKELRSIKAIAAKGKLSGLTQQLAEAFYTAGNRLAGSTLLAEIDKETPNLYYEMRLLEEFYGFRKWDKVEYYLSLIEKKGPGDLPLKKEEALEVLTLFRRFIVQVDAEMQVVKELNGFLKRSIDVYLSFYPRDDLRKKMQSGWLNAEEDDAKKLVKIKKWITEDLSLGVPPADLRELRQSRLALAQKLRESEAVIEESKAIALILQGSKEADEFTYITARELYEQKKYEVALPLLQSLVKTAPSKWSVMSQNIVLDIFNQTKRYDDLIGQVALWKNLTAHTAHSANEELKKENQAMEQILIQAQFEKAVQSGETPLALESFYKFCMEGNYVEKSCANARVLAVKFKDQTKLIHLLEKMGDQEALLQEYELMGRFADAARLQEKLKLNDSVDLPLFLKTAFLFELDQEYADRDRILKKVMEKMKREKTLTPALEGAIFATLKDARLLDAKALSLPWSLPFKLEVAGLLEREHSSPSTRKILLSQKEIKGPLWSKLALAKVEEQYFTINKMKFQGENSQALFKRRTRALTSFATEAKGLLDEADLEMRVYLLHMLKNAYKKLALEILNTPIPDGLDAKTLERVAGQISTMADPFDRTSEDYERLLVEQMSALKEEDKKRITANLAADVKSYANFIAQDLPPEKARPLDHSLALTLKKKLEVAPEDRETLIKLKEFYAQNGSDRLALYYSGRIDNLKPTE